MNRRPARCLRMSAILAGVFLASPLAAQIAETAAERPVSDTLPSEGEYPPRPRVGLVLGGGGAKGGAHIGVLRVLEELRVPVDCVAGTSMGALIGGTYAAGRPPAEIETTVLGIDWSSTVGGRGSRDRMPIERKLTDFNYSNSLELGIKGGRLRAPSGFIASQEIEGQIFQLVSAAEATRDFDELPIPFRAVATDMVSGEMVVLERGDLAVALRASMAIPGAFTPVTMDGKVLADGGLMRNLPIDVARALCADVVIAVWVSTPSPDPADVESALSVVGRSLDVMIIANEREQIETLTDADVGIEVAVGDIGTLDFQRIGEAIELGRRAAEARRESLLRYALPDDEYRAWRDAIDTHDRDQYTIADVRIVGVERVNPDYLRSQLKHTRPGASVLPEEIASDAERLFALGDFQRVAYRLRGAPDGRTVEFRPVEKPWGPDFLRFDLGLATPGDGEIRAILRADHDRTWMNARGGRWHNAAQLGQQSILSTDFYQPLDVEQRFFVQPSLEFQSNLDDFYIDGDRVARYDIRELYGQVDFGMNLGTRAQLRAGLRRSWLEADRDTGDLALPDLDRAPDTSLQLRAVYDTRDSVALPTDGSFLNIRYVSSKSWFDGEFDYSLAEAVFARAFDIGGNSLSLIVGGGDTLEGELPVTEQIELGGIRTFPGLRPGELRGGSYWFAGTSYSWRLADLQPLFGQALYGGLRLQAGEMRDRIDAVEDEVLYGIAGTLSGRTPIGAFLLSLGWVEDSGLRLQFTLGRPVAEGSVLDELQ